VLALAARFAARRARPGADGATPAHPVLEIALLVTAVLATVPIVNAVFDLNDYRTFLTAGLLTGRAIGLLSLPVSLAVALDCASVLPELERSRGRAAAIAILAFAPALVWWRVVERPARPFWTHVSSTVDRALARLADPRGPRIAAKEVAEEGLWYSAIADDALRHSGAIDRLGRAVGPVAERAAASARAAAAPQDTPSPKSD